MLKMFFLVFIVQSIRFKGVKEALSRFKDSAEEDGEDNPAQKKVVGLLKGFIVKTVKGLLQHVYPKH